MGTGGSRLQGSRRPLSRPHHFHHHRPYRRSRPKLKRVLSSLLICGSVPPSNPHHHEMEDDPAEKLVSSSEKDAEKIHFPDKVSSFSNGTIPHSIESDDGTAMSSRILENCHGEDIQREPEVIDKGKSLSKNKELVLDPASIATGRVDEASTSYEDQHSSESESANITGNADPTDRGIYAMDSDVQQNHACSLGSSFQPHNGQVESLSGGVSIGNTMDEVMVFHDCETSPASALSPSAASDIFQQASPASLSFLVTERDQVNRDTDVLQVDVLSVSSDVSSISAADLSYHEARRNSRRLFWDAFSRRGSRRHADSRSSIYTTDDSDGFDFHDRRLFDFNSDFLDNASVGSSRSNGNNNQHPSEHRWHSSSELWERFRDAGRNGLDRRTAATCASGVHPDGACSCGSMIRAEESGARASISRIVMLAEALFEVLDEIHRQPMPLSLSVASLPAPESVVDSLPVKDHEISERTENGNDVTQCYICLADYEEGDKIRILPCHHEYHLACVDKWLKEIHGVCPLCRGDVRGGLDMREGAISGTEVH
ncbi:OLC1v1038134C1 [Oldenlandia corymbosa var. corymbosa]|uniref:OLC1v1038134C1 n=1 Tax=Oldenlandia corymbosa var. corymbosa TaxID=529605 RepID=A0AAV1D0A3_OLDCO|nr:OLC1v1038134C1 [Oldenlandia corymbosa var. corymbosa]